ncbi:DNA cytosine methyltransferase [Halioglobus maricola]|uniref:DNA (cytosine-5-)-methyltransferase n=1 Tax=Halioglobus maricola TaxID=2601894 RepID=A0A5P9NHP3_9GAMM|nr:DNA cytosine methyltransferase [Halioglobus maricola]QFU75347.1 DNA cytosine methyltransferase [Halioglobus maricola]
MYSTLSLFTGAGGLDLGLHAAGFRTKVAVECDPVSIETLRFTENRKWWKSTEICSEAIEDVSSERLLEMANLGVGEARLLVGGPPCQPFSKSGYWHSGDAQRLDDPRANTLSEYLRVLEDSLPEVFLLENVPGLAFSEKDDGLKLLKSEVAAINKRQGTNYSLKAAQLNAASYGVPQTRERVFVIGHRDGKEFEFPEASHQLPPRVDMSAGITDMPPRRVVGGLQPWSTAWDALAKIKTPDDPDLHVRGKWADLLPSIPEGHNYLYHTERGKGVPLFGWRRRYWSMLLKLAKNRPSWTLTAQPGPAIGPFHWENRRLSSRELCALQTFPADYQIVGNCMMSHRQVGNAVPSALAEVLGREIRRQFFEETQVSTIPTLLPQRQKRTPSVSPVAPVAKKYEHLIGDYEEHPGTGRGPGASRRASNQ